MSPPIERLDQTIEMLELMNDALRKEVLDVQPEASVSWFSSVSVFRRGSANSKHWLWQHAASVSFNW